MINKAILIGNLGQDPEVIQFDNGNKLAKFSLATSETWKDKNGESKTETQWHKIVIMGRSAETAEKYLKKGSKIYIEGVIKYRSWETKEGERKESTEINSVGFKFLDSRGSTATTNNNAETFVIEDDDLPF